MSERDYAVIELAKTLIQQLYDHTHEFDPKVHELTNIYPQFGSTLSAQLEKMISQFQINNYQYVDEAKEIIRYFNVAFSRGLVRDGPGNAGKLRECKAENATLNQRISQQEVELDKIHTGFKQLDEENKLLKEALARYGIIP